MWYIIILLYLVLLSAILLMAFRKRKLYPIEITKKKYISIGAASVAGLFLFIGIFGLIIIFLPSFQKLLFGKDSVVFLGFTEANTPFLLMMLVAIGLLIATFSFYLLVIFQSNTVVWVFYRDLKERSLKIPDFSEPTDFSEENIQFVADKLKIFLRTLAIISIVLFLIADLAFLSYEKFTDKQIISVSYGNFYKSEHGYEDIEKVEISIGRSPNGKNPVLNYYLYFNDESKMKFDDYNQLIKLHTLLKEKNVAFVYLPYTQAQYEELINRYVNEKKSAYEFVFSDNLQ